MAGIYIHIPFCRQACHYCDFHFSTSRHHTHAMIRALASEIKMRSDYLQGRQVSTIYFGGGTPSLLAANQIGNLLELIRDLFPVEQACEVTLEANPDDLSQPYLSELLEVGINRLSIGVQTFHPEILRWMNRAHTRDQSIEAVREAGKAGFNNISIDLIYAIPVEGHHLREDLQQALSLQPDHISAYNLTIEPQTVLGRQYSKGLLEEVSEEKAACDFEEVIEVLEREGFGHYEISNFALPGKQSRHNWGYWQRDPYLGIGPSAHSFTGDTRHVNIAHNMKYLKAIESGCPDQTTEILDRARQINECIMLGLRTLNGIDLNHLLKVYQCDLADSNGEYLQGLLSGQFARITENRLILTKKGLLIADRIASDLFIVE